MSILRSRVLQALFLAALTTGAAQAQPVTNPQIAPSAAPTEEPARERKSSIEWHNGRGPEYFVAGDYVLGTNSRNEFNPLGTNDSNSWAARAAVEYPIGKLAVMAEGTYDHFQYTTQAGMVPTIGNAGQTFVPSFYAHDVDWDARAGIGLQYPRIFLVASYGQRHNNYGYPNLQGVGFGIEKLPDFNEKTISFFGSFLYYPQFGAGTTIQYGFYKYQAGVEYHVRESRVPLFVEAGYMGDYGYNKLNAPTNISDNGFFGGLGVHL